MKNINRIIIRKFFRIAALIAVILITGCSSFALKTANNFKPAKKVRFAFLPDMHYAHAGKMADAGTSWGLKEKGLVDLVDYLKKQNLDFVMLGGDFCNIDFWFTNAVMVSDAHDAFNRVQSEFKRLNIPIYYLRGNHETFRALVNGVPDKKNKFVGDKLYRYHCGYGTEKSTYYDFDYAGIKFIALDSGGMIDDIKLLNIAESGNWVATQYNNQVNPNSFYKGRFFITKLSYVTMFACMPNYI